MDTISKLTEIIQNAVRDYAEHREQAPEEWLQDYLGRTLNTKGADVVRDISKEIIETTVLMEDEKSAMNSAMANGQSAENWFTSEIFADTDSNGEKAKTAAEFFNGISNARASVEDRTNEAHAADKEFVDTSEESEWQDSNWNDYKLKDILKKICTEAGKLGMSEIASDVFTKASQEGIAAALSGEFVRDIVVDAADKGLKFAVSAGLAVAQERNIIPLTTFNVLATTAHRTVESMSAIGDAVKGKCTVTEALIRVKNTAVSTFSGLWKQHKNKVAEEITDAVGNVFGAKGAVIAGAVSGLFVDKKENESRFVTILKEAGKAVLRFMTKESHVPFFRKNKALQLNN